MLGHFDPFIAGRSLAAMFECAANALLVDAGVVAKRRSCAEQRPEKAHDGALVG